MATLDKVRDTSHRSKAMAPVYQSSPVTLKSVMEREKKLAVGADFRLPILSGRPLPRRVFTSVYFDTIDHCLARAGVTLRRRIEVAR